MPTNPLQFDLLDLAQPAGPHRPHSHTHRQPRSKPDASNPTGYAQTIEEITDSSVTKSYTIGLDVISQAINDSGLTGTLQTYLYDGHGSVRQLVDEVGQVVKAALDSIGGPEVLKLDYDAYGQAINFAAATAVSALLNSGEFADAATGQQYLRARFYDPTYGRFNRVDPFAGVFTEPQSLHKYLYGHGDPINNVDPSGQFITVLPLLLGGAAAGGLLFGGLGLGARAIGSGTVQQALNSAINGAVAGGFLGLASGIKYSGVLTAFTPNVSAISAVLEGFYAGLGFLVVDIIADAIQFGTPGEVGRYVQSFSFGFQVGSITETVDQLSFSTLPLLKKIQHINAITDILGPPFIEMALVLFRGARRGTRVNIGDTLASAILTLINSIISRDEYVSSVVDGKIGKLILDRARQRGISLSSDQLEVVGKSITPWLSNVLGNLIIRFS